MNRNTFTLTGKGLYVTILSLFIAATAMSQNAVRKHVASLKASGETFERYQPFANDAKAPIATLAQLDIPQTALSEATVLRPNAEVFSELENLRPERLTLEIPAVSGITQEALTLDLYQKSIFTDDATIQSSDNPGEFLPLPDAVFYRGVVEGQERSIVALTLLDGNLSGLISFGSENLIMGRAKDAPNNEHVLYPGDALNIEEEFQCTALESDEYEIPQHESQDVSKTIKCVRMRIEVDNGLTASLGGVAAATNYATGLYNQVITMYDNDDIDVTVSEIYVWNGSSPYSGDLNSRFNQLTNNSPNADLMQLLTNVGGGGIGWISGVCSNNYGVSIAGIYGYYYNVPSYSWDVNVTTHEIGHNLSSPHTHACAWNGNNTAIDGCGPYAGYSEGCNASLPSGGGTVMSYCHLTYVGMNFSYGFGPQPSARIQNYVNSKGCLTSGCGGGPTTCDDNSVTLDITFDNYPQETSWEITDAGNTVVASGDNYNGQSSASIDVCLVDGCYTLSFFDSYGDGMCCSYGNGSFSLTDDNSNVLASGGQYTNQIDMPFCVGQPPANCDYINFNDFTIGSYAGNRDIGTATILDGGATLYLQNNALKSIGYNYNVTANTVLEFDFRSTDQTHVHGAGFDNNNGLSLNRIFKIYGTLNNGQIISDYDTYSGTSYQNFQIPLGSYYNGSNLTKLFFLTTKKNTPGAGNGYFKNVRVYEAGQCGSSTAATPMATVNLAEKEGFVLYPNPTTESAKLISAGDTEIEVIRVYNAAGAMVSESNVHAPFATINMADRGQGLYIVTWTDSEGNSHSERLVKSK